jgi:tRNA-dihydrouridine synthase 1
MFHSRLFATGAGSSKYRDSHFQPTKIVNSSSSSSSRSNAPPQTSQKPAADTASQTLDIVPYLDGNPTLDRPLFVQFCTNDPSDFLSAAQLVAPHCDAVDLNLGCPQGIARKGHYGAFLQEDWSLIHGLIRTLHNELPIPVTAKFRILETKEKTLEYAKMILDAGASIITIHGRRREQKGHLTGLADLSVVRYLREQLPKDTVLFVNGNVLLHADLDEALKVTGADGVMSAEGNLADPTIFARPFADGEEVHENLKREYWRSKDGGRAGFRVDAVMRRYLDIVYRYVLGREPPERKPLWVPEDPESASICGESSTFTSSASASASEQQHQGNNSTSSPPLSSSTTLTTPTATNASANGTITKRPASDDTSESYATPSKKKQKRDKSYHKPPHVSSPNLAAIQPHLFHLLRPLVSKHHNVRDKLARAKPAPDNIDAFEEVLLLVERAVEEGIREYDNDPQHFEQKLREEAFALGRKGGKVDETKVETRSEQTDGKQGSAYKATTSKSDSVDNLETQESSLEAVLRCKKPYWVCQPYVRPLPAEALSLGSVTLSKKEKAKIELKKIREQEDVHKTEQLVQEGIPTGLHGVSREGMIGEGVVAG